VKSREQELKTAEEMVAFEEAEIEIRLASIQRKKELLLKRNELELAKIDEEPNETSEDESSEDESPSDYGTARQVPRVQEQQKEGSLEDDLMVRLQNLRSSNNVAKTPVIPPPIESKDEVAKNGTDQLA
jgi:hypothetical protein